MGFTPLLFVNTNITIDTMLKFDANAVKNINIDDQCEWTLRLHKRFSGTLTLEASMAVWT